MPSIVCHERIYMNKVVLINGGSRGIGRAMVELFSSHGYSVAFTYKSSKEAAEALALKCGALAIRADSASEAEVDAAVSEVEEKLGNVDILINNAAVSSFSMFSDLDYEAWRNCFSVNVDGAFFYTRRTVGCMVRRHCGRIINIASMWGQVGSSCEVHYSASKAALIGMTKALAKELGPSGITVNAIAPGVIDTDMNSALAEEDIKALEEQTPLMRIGKPREVAEAALYLASDGAAFVTGAVLNVNGGMVV